MVLNIYGEKIMKDLFILVLFALGCCGFLALSLGAQTTTPPFKEKEITFKVGDIALAGTLTIPDSPGPHAAIILVAGGDPDERDAAVGNFKFFKLVAHHFAEKGLAVLRFDDRGVGKSGGKHVWQYTVEDYSDDILAAVKFLKEQKNVNPEKIGLCAHCGGALSSLMAVSRSKEIAFMIALAPPVTRGDETFKLCRKYYFEDLKKSPEEIDETMKLEERIQQTARSGKGFDELEAFIKKKARRDFDKLPEEQRKPFKDFDAYFAATYDGAMVKVIRTPFYRYMLDYDPIPFIEKITCPILVLYGGADIFALPEIHKDKFADTLKKAGNKDYTIKVIPKADHIFTENWGVNGTFVPGFLETMSDWLVGAAGRR
jgi:pimeloyl-ACP methyl ester carboxylesterase